MEVEKRKAELKKMMAEYKVTCREVSHILDNKETTVRMWRSRSPNHFPPRNELRLLRYELEARKAEQNKTPATANS